MKKINKKDTEIKDRLIEIVQLKPDDWRTLRRLKLKSLSLEPVAFEDQKKGMARYLSRTEEEWRMKLDENISNTISVFAKDDDKYIGMVNGVLKPEERKAVIEHMYVDPSYRGMKIGRKLLEDLIWRIKQKDNIEKAELGVIKTQLPARRLYESSGFKKVKKVKAKRGNQTYTELEMELRL